MYVTNGLDRPDLESIRQWRNAQRNILRNGAKEITEQEQSEWYGKWAESLCINKFTEYHWSIKDVSESGILHEAKLVAYCGLVHIDWVFRRAETSFLSDPTRHDHITYGKDFNAGLEWMFSMARAGFFDLHELTSVTYTDVIMESRPHDVHMGLLNKYFPTYKAMTVDGHEAVVHRAVLA
jgi:hypothetical protein